MLVLMQPMEDDDGVVGESTCVASRRTSYLAVPSFVSEMAAEAGHRKFESNRRAKQEEGTGGGGGGGAASAWAACGRFRRR